jgi:hypothetical protein
MPWGIAKEPQRAQQASMEKEPWGRASEVWAESERRAAIASERARPSRVVHHQPAKPSFGAEYHTLLAAAAALTTTAAFTMSFAGRRRANKVKKGIQFTMMVVGERLPSQPRPSFPAVALFLFFFC